MTFSIVTVVMEKLGELFAWCGHSVFTHFLPHEQIHLWWSPLVDVRVMTWWKILWKIMLVLLVRFGRHRPGGRLWRSAR